MFVIRMDKNTNLYAISPKKLYVGESNADILQFIVPPVVGIYDLSILLPVLHYVSVDGVEKTAELHYADDYKDQLSFVIAPPRDMMYSTGSYPIWLEWLDVDYNFVFKSGSMKLEIISNFNEDDVKEIELDVAAELDRRVDLIEEKIESGEIGGSVSTDDVIAALLATDTLAAVKDKDGNILSLNNDIILW